MRLKVVEIPTYREGMYFAESLLKLHKSSTSSVTLEVYKEPRGYRYFNTVRWESKSKHTEDTHMRQISREEYQLLVRHAQMERWHRLFLRDFETVNRLHEYWG